MPSDATTLTQSYLFEKRIFTLEENQITLYVKDSDGDEYTGDEK